MDIKVAEDFYFRGITPEDATVAEQLQLCMGACLTDEGDIVCLRCGRPNECCECGREEEEPEHQGLRA